MKLGAKLQETIAELEAANIKGLAAQATADMTKIKAERDHFRIFLDNIREDFSATIKSGRVPMTKITESRHTDWLEKVSGSIDAPHQDLWNQFVSFFKTEALRVNVNNEHDGVGKHSWTTISVAPVKPGTRDGSFGGKRTVI